MLIIIRVMIGTRIQKPGETRVCRGACWLVLLSYNPNMETHLDKRFGFLISDVGRLCSKRFDELAKSSLDLTRAQCRALPYLSHFGDVNQARLADLLEVAPISAAASPPPPAHAPPSPTSSPPPP